jgi:hypothetical protein
VADIEGTVVAMGTCRMLRIRHVGLKYFCEQMHYKRNQDNSVEERWTTVAVATGRTARGEAFQWLGDANVAIIKTWEGDHDTKRPVATIKPA